ncbi:hypothetical protein [Kitasatospora sp. NPDC127116]|uniref:hypothetical protein n=1 Tax=Kitasatospora sp. NPDC127116 TaxID=3345367 RepID=UPI00363049ED
MNDQHEPVPRDSPVPVETPESRMAGESAPRSGHERSGNEEEKRRRQGAESETTAPAHDPDPHEPPD